MSQVQLTGHDGPAVLLLNAMSEKLKDHEDILTIFNLKPENGEIKAEVVVTVNGVEVDFMGEVAHFVKQVHDSIDSLVNEKALELWRKPENTLRDASDELMRIADDIDVLRWKARQILNSLED